MAGDWTLRKDRVSLDKPNGRIVYSFHARDLHLVMGPAAPGSSIRIRVTVDGQPPGAAHGLDIDELGNGTVTDQRLYQLIRQPAAVRDRRFERKDFEELGTTGGKDRDRLAGRRLPLLEMLLDALDVLVKTLALG